MHLIMLWTYESWKPDLNSPQTLHEIKDTSDSNSYANHSLSLGT